MYRRSDWSRPIKGTVKGCFFFLQTPKDTDSTFCFVGFKNLLDVRDVTHGVDVRVRLNFVQGDRHT